MELAELADDNRRLTGFLRAAHTVCGTYNDVASTSPHLQATMSLSERRACSVGADWQDGRGAN
ncbi:MAG: hypothetical protein E5V18_02955 [Mesorhizobium sp.]|nr:MAG: hypothetical protein E5V18_02955 [Mesorhizobium sp.]